MKSNIKKKVTFNKNPIYEPHEDPSGSSTISSTRSYGEDKEWARTIKRIVERNFNNPEISEDKDMGLERILANYKKNRMRNNPGEHASSPWSSMQDDNEIEDREEKCFCRIS